MYTQTKQLILSAPVERWDEAIPLGNGIIGVLLWGGGNVVKLSLDRGDLWDERSDDTEKDPCWRWQTIMDAAKSGDCSKLNIFERLYSLPYPSKLSAGRIEITFNSSISIDSFILNMSAASGSVKSAGKNIIEVFCDANSQIIRMKFGIQPVAIKIVPPGYAGENQIDSSGMLPAMLPAMLGYPPGELETDGVVSFYRQTCAEKMQYAIALDRLSDEILFTVQKTVDTTDPADLAMKLIGDAKTVPFADTFREHCRWWKAFWQRSRVILPDKILERHYNLSRYFYGSASRPGYPPMPLQGLWTADEGKLPPWKGDYHHDLNTQMTYWASLTAGHFEEGRCFLDHLWKQVPVYRKFAGDFYAAPGIAIPGVCSLSGKALGGWPQYSMSPTASAWLAKMFADYWRYTRDEVFLREQAWPFVSGVGEFLASLLRENADGQLELPVSTSPEIHNNTPAAFLTPNSNHDLALLRKLFTDIIELGRELLCNEEVERYQKLLSRLPELATDATAGLKLSPDAILTESHRHHAHLMAVYPLDLLIPENESERKIIVDSLRHIDQLGTGMWVGFSFPWMACINARAGFGNRAEMLLAVFMKGFLSRNGFNLNGDFKDLGCSWFKYRPFTLEGNFALAQAVHEMLLQSHGGVIRIFPALPESWSDIEFTGLRAEGGFSVSAALSNNQIVSIKISAAKNGVLNLKNPFKIKKNIICNHPDLDFSAPVIVCAMSAGEILTIDVLNDV